MGNKIARGLFNITPTQLELPPFYTSEDSDRRARLNALKRILPLE